MKRGLVLPELNDDKRDDLLDIELAVERAQGNETDGFSVTEIDDVRVMSLVVLLRASADETPPKEIDLDMDQVANYLVDSYLTLLHAYLELLASNEGKVA